MGTTSSRTTFPGARASPRGTNVDRLHVIHLSQPSGAPGGHLTTQPQSSPSSSASGARSGRRNTRLRIHDRRGHHDGGSAGSAARTSNGNASLSRSHSGEGGGRGLVSFVSVASSQTSPSQPASPSTRGLRQQPKPPRIWEQEPTQHAPRMSGARRVVTTTSGNVRESKLGSNRRRGGGLTILSGGGIAPTVDTLPSPVRIIDMNPSPGSVKWGYGSSGDSTPHPSQLPFRKRVVRSVQHAAAALWLRMRGKTRVMNTAVSPHALRRGSSKHADMFVFTNDTGGMSGFGSSATVLRNIRSSSYGNMGGSDTHIALVRSPTHSPKTSPMHNTSAVGTDSGVEVLETMSPGRAPQPRRGGFARRVSADVGAGGSAGVVARRVMEHSHSPTRSSPLSPRYVRHRSFSKGSRMRPPPPHRSPERSPGGLPGAPSSRMRRASFAGVVWQCANQLGTGRLGSVYLALNESTGGLMVAKQTPSAPHAAWRAFRSRVLALMSLKHPGLVTYLGVERRRSRGFVLTQWMSGGSLAAVLAQNPQGLCSDSDESNDGDSEEGGGVGSTAESSGTRNSKETLACKYIKGILVALHFLHSMGKWHGDVKPSNVWSDEAGRVLLSDFGVRDVADALLAAQLQHIPDAGDVKIEEDEPSQRNVSLPKNGYDAPEVQAGGLPSAAGDVWSLGAIVRHLMTGSPTGELDGSVSPQMRDFVASCQQPDVEQRATTVNLMMHTVLDATHVSGSSARITGEGLFRTASMLAVL